MTKARTLADFISDGSPLADGTISVSEVSGAAPIESPTFTGTITSTGDVVLGDNDKAIFGAGSDLQIYHDDSDGKSYIRETGSGNFEIRASNLRLKDATGGNYLAADADAAVTAYYDGSAKLATTSTGIDVTGDVGADTATITGKTTTDELDLNAIAATIADTAVDVFVYDTSKDSDGGTWRKRTQGTSWYNETLNTATRGARKEFPAVAVIVLESNYLTVYDGDDPDLPMWMVFNCNNGNLDLLTDATSKAVTALNGIVNVATTGHLTPIDFISEEAGHYTTSGNKYYLGSIAQRNDAIGHGSYDGTVPIVNTSVNDVAMTVLPNAPIDAATGLPVPTIAVATDGGMSVIKDDGTVVDITQSHGGTTAVDHLTIDPVTNAIYFTTDYGGSGQAYKINAVPIPSADRAENSSVYNGFQDYFFQMQAGGNLTVPHFINTGSVTESVDINVLQSTGEGAFAVGEGLGLDQIIEDRSGLDNSMIAYTTSNYATGWMNGDIKLATLSDTDDTDVTGSELVTNGDFASNNFNSWTIVSGSSYLSVSGGIAISDTTSGSGGVAPTIEQVISTQVGKSYTISVEGLQWTTGNWTMISLDGTSVLQDNNGVADVGDYYDSTNSGHYTFTATKTSYTIGWRSRHDTTRAELNSISVRLAEEDRSVNGNGVQVFGSITKNPVASGADLVAYSGFSANGSYLEQPYNADYDVGTGDYAVSLWFKNIDYGTALIGRYDTKGWLLSISSGGGGGGLVHAIYTQGFTSSGRTTVSTSTDQSSKGWQQVWAIRRSGQQEIWLNGELVGSVANTADLDDTSAVLRVGTYTHDATTKSSGEFALARVSATAPSPEQIKKIYEDEKVLFQENAQATLYGSSDAVTALAYDDSTELLHVGTSAGRSDFQGLRRVNNTTNAVGAAISASNGMIVEE